MNLPQDFHNNMVAAIGEDDYALLAQALCDAAPTSIRLNTGKARWEELDIVAQAESTPVPWCPEGRYLSRRPQFTFDPFFHAGCYYVQEASSMFLSHILRHYITRPVTALDLCAAPGGKSTLALSALPSGSWLVANEAIRSRAHILAENVAKWGKPNCIVTNGFANDLEALHDTFDLILCDAPCSGEGMFRKDPNSIEQWSVANVATCQERQRDIVSHIWPTLKEGGLLIYSTCTYNPHENEENIDWMVHTLGAEELSCHPLPQWNLTETRTHFYPHRQRGEGFFVSILRKGNADDNYVSAPSSKKERPTKKRKHNEPDKFGTFASWLTTSEGFNIHEADGHIRAVPTALMPLLQRLQNHIRVLHAGIPLAVPRGKDYQPHHCLAMSELLNPTAFPQAELDHAQAIAYLRAEMLNLPSSTPRGYVIVTHQGHPLGFVKNIGTRANNLYPSEWRIRSISP